MRTIIYNPTSAAGNRSNAQGWLRGTHPAPALRYNSLRESLRIGGVGLMRDVSGNPFPETVSI
ncbi:MAG: hypothetical protein ACYC0V_19600, partial [Armatimonadota bacterium]